MSRLLRGEIQVGKHLLRILAQKDGSWRGIILGRSNEPVSGATAGEVEAALRRKLAGSNSGFIGYAGARSRFLTLFPQGFADPAYIGHTKTGERAYKDIARDFLARELPPEQVDGSEGQGQLALKAFQKTNLVDPHSKARLADLLRGPRAGDWLQYIRDFALGDIDGACRGLNAGFHGDGGASWVAVTYLPYFWRPEQHMFLKPEVSKLFAERVGHSFLHSYDPKPNAGSYAALLDMMAELGDHLAELGPRDNIDLQSVVWSVVAYKVAESGPAPDQP
ncbi:hypothetical protein [Pseudogemmobacter bohemicus]|uniref:hypothetical protein n=1 Tax=Pseudogemmobacter bohemicus TaxID=2250708 RepID=UPI000DD32EB0|nr:hypothetical protein [Pseudogemmobacter bohemicus]